jgi:hypothetical protein
MVSPLSLDRGVLRGRGMQGSDTTYERLLALMCM